MPSSLPELWLRGVAANPAAPSDVLLRLLDPAAGEARRLLCQGRDLPPEVIDAVVTHSEMRVRWAFARNPHVDPARLRPLADDPSALVRGNLAGGPHPRQRQVRPLPDEILEALLTARDDDHDGVLTSGEIAQELVASRQIPQSFRRRLPEHPHPKLRLFATHSTVLTPRQREALLADPDPAVRESVQRQDRYLDPEAMEAELPDRDCHARHWMLGSAAVSRAVVEACFAEGRNLYSLARNPHTPADAVARLARDPDPEVRERVAARADIGPSLLAELADDPDEAVRTRARVHALPRTPAQCVVIDLVVGSYPFDCTFPIGDMAVEPDMDWYRACAVSEHPVLRRAAASQAALPAELVPPLAEDPDPEVRDRLACHHPLAPPELVLDTFVTRPAYRPHLLTLARLPRTGLGRLLDHEDAEVRALAAADPTLAEPPVRLLDDPDEAVRRAAAANPLLGGEALAALLDDPRTAEGAAANPRLPAELLHELLDRAGLGPGVEDAADRTLDRRDNSPVT